MTVTCVSNEHLEIYQNTDADKYADIWNDYDGAFQEALTSDNIDMAHDIWCKAAETFLWWLCNGNTTLLGNKP